MTYDVLVYGPAFCDLVFTDVPALPVLGEELFAGGFTATIGGSAIVAAGLHRLGARVGLIADLGDDPLSRMMRDMLVELGLDCTLIREHAHPLPQVTVALAFPHDRAFVTRFQRPDMPRNLAAVLRDHPARHVHVCGFLAALESPEACRIAHAAGMTISMDPGWDEQALRDPRLAAMVRALDLFMPNQKELCHYAGTDDAAEAAARVHATMRDGALVIKQGAAGATAWDRSASAPMHVDALPVTPVDTTGAGDAFDAGFLSQYVHGAPLVDCMRVGAVCGSLSTMAAGGIGALPTRAEVEAWLARSQS